MPDTLWQLEHVELHTAGKTRLGNIDVTIAADTTAILGESGAGKTTLLNLLIQYERPTRGRVTATLPQTHALPLFWAPHGDGLWPHLSVRKHLQAVEPTGRSTTRQSVDELIDAFDLTGCADRRPAALSQGERARLNVARCLAADPAVMVMDEPLVHVDESRAPRYWQHIREHIDRRGCSFVFSTHDPQNVLAEAQRVVCLTQGEIIYDGDVDSLYEDPQTPQLAACLGAHNWFEPDDAKQWLNLNGVTARCIRPENLLIAIDGQSPLIVENSSFRGSIAYVRVRHDEKGIERMLVHRPAADKIKAGDRVSLGTSK